jgi:hypothetical protein
MLADVGVESLEGTAISLDGSQPSVTTIRGGRRGTSAMTSPPPVSMSSAETTPARCDAINRE